ncbi:MAG TPA: glycosyltransferase [Candidatus Limnocylindria bacterium]|nr:glycosyltransferase [Candidatus Limnocylindria bacterium]
MSTPLRVLHLITRLTLGGSAENTVASTLGLMRSGYDCTLAAGLPGSDADVVADARRRGCVVVDVPSLRREVGVHDLVALVALVRLMRQYRPAIVHTHTSKAGFTGRLAARIARVPVVIHQPHGHIFYGYYGPRTTAFYVALERRAARWTDVMITLTARGTEEHLARGIGRPAQYVSVPSGVPTGALRARAPSRAAARARLGLGPGDFAVAALGRLVPVKGFDLLVAALPRLAQAAPGARLLLIGDGPERPALEALASRLGVSGRLTITGATSDVGAYLAAADVFAAPSRNEGMGRALVEAMALGLPVIGAAVGGIPAVVTDGVCGRLVPAEDAGALAEALAELARDGALRAKLGAAAVERADAFSTAVADAALLAVYEGLVRARGRR